MLAAERIAILAVGGGRPTVHVVEAGLGEHGAHLGQHVECLMRALRQLDTFLTAEQALDEAIELTRRWLRGAPGSVEDFIATLEALRDTPIVTELPGTGAALAELQQLVATPAAAPAEPVQ